MNMRPALGRCLPRVLLLCALIARSQAAELPSAPALNRFTGSGASQTIRASEDGRFAIGGHARLYAPKRSMLERFTVPSAPASGALCSPQGDAIFANGFEP